MSQKEPENHQEEVEMEEVDTDDEEDEEDIEIDIPKSISKLSRESNPLIDGYAEFFLTMKDNYHSVERAHDNYHKFTSRNELLEEVTKKYEKHVIELEKMVEEGEQYEDSSDDEAKQ